MLEAAVMEMYQRIVMPVPKKRLALIYSVPFDDYDEALEEVNNSRYGLQAGVYPRYIKRTKHGTCSTLVVWSLEMYLAGGQHVLWWREDSG